MKREAWRRNENRTTQLSSSSILLCLLCLLLSVWWILPLCKGTKGTIEFFPRTRKKKLSSSRAQKNLKHKQQKKKASRSPHTHTIRTRINKSEKWCTQRRRLLTRRVLFTAFESRAAREVRISQEFKFCFFIVYARTNLRECFFAGARRWFPENEGRESKMRMEERRERVWIAS